MTKEHETKPSEWDYRVTEPNDWCAGCGDFGILRALKKALAALELPGHQVAVFGGIGCSGKAVYNLNVYGIHTLHGRLLPFASGAKLANPDLNVIAIGGDGDGLGIGAGHFVNAGRRNLDLTYILCNNEVYGLTKGQAAPTLGLGDQTKSMPQPNIQDKANPLMLALASGFTWIGRGYAYDVEQLSELIQNAIRHPGFAYLDVLQPCPKYNDLHTKDWFSGKDRLPKEPRLYSLQKQGYDPRLAPGTDADTVAAKISQCAIKAQEWEERIPTGVFLENLSAEDFGTRIAARLPAYRSSPPAQRIIADDRGRPLVDLEALLTEFMVVGKGPA